ncbi:MAG TPA: amidohydrolase family protein, partial [Syntrophobacteraceae bacterium]|nr:amidohydrolase family protein [Syntrophobacteraceae bacterium]
EQQVYWVPTLFTMKAYASLLEPGSLESRVAALNLESQLEQVSRARAMGVLLAVGTDSGSLGVHHGTSFVEELKLLQEAGLDLHEILRAATLHGAALLGVEDECGPLRVGSPATFVALLGPPSRLIESLSRPTVVCIRGVDVLRGSMPIPGPRPGPLCSFP